MIYLILIVLAIIGVGVFLLIAWLNKKRLCKEFERCNVIVFGKKGTGKDLLFQAIINSRKKPYYSNVNYGGFFNYACPKSLELSHNDYKNFINGEVVQEVKPNYEHKDFYFSDCGIILPSQYDTTLYKLFPSFPISYALSRHLYENNIHCNTQALSRVWKSLREQADYYVKCRNSIKIFGLLITFYTTYEKYESANNDLRPLTARMLNKYSKVDVDNYIATNGLIKNGFIIQRKKSVVYDTRAYHSIIFGFPAPIHSKKSSLKKRAM